MDVVFVDLEVVDAVALRRIQLDFTDAPRELRAARRRIGNDRNEQGRQQPHHFSLLRQSTASVYCVSLLRQSTASVYCVSLLRQSTASVYCVSLLRQSTVTLSEDF